MALPPIVDHTQGAMSRRARVYISAGGLRHLGIGATMLAAPWLYSAAAFVPIFNLVGQIWWASIMVVVGLVCIVGAFTRKVDIARAGMIGSAVVTVVLATGLTFGLLNVWFGFLNAVGQHGFFELLIDRPAVYPKFLLGIYPAPPSPLLAFLLLSLSVKDFTMCAQPLRVPLEDQVEVARLRRR